jgi:hypothetical protein
MLTVSIDYLRDQIDYDPITGVLTWKKSSANGVRRAGTTCGRVDKCGHRIVNLDCRTHMAHRIAWAIFYGQFPEMGIDHINGVGDDNRIANLRLATQSQNIANRIANGTSGFRGVSKTRHGKWFAQIKKDGTTKYLGTFATKELAAQAYEDAARIVFGEFRFSQREVVAAERARSGRVVPPPSR